MRLMFCFFSTALAKQSVETLAQVGAAGEKQIWILWVEE